MPRPRSAIAVTTLVVGALAASTCAPASAAPIVRSPLFAASATGLAASLVGGLVNTGPYSPVAITTRSTTKQASANAATVGIPGVVGTGPVSSTVSTARNTNDNATIVTARARTEKLNLLGGAVTLAAVATSASLTVRPAKVTGTTRTTFANLKIAGNPVINGEVAPNTTIEVPGVARVVLNASGVAGGQREGAAAATGILITLLGGSSAGSIIAVNSTSVQTQFVSQFYAPLNGVAFGAQVSADGGDPSVNVGPLGAIGMPSTGTSGQTLTATLASSPLLGLGTLGASTSTAVGTVSNASSRSTMTNTITGLNLLGGLVTADALTSKADVLLDRNGVTTPKASVVFTNLRIAGVPIDLAVAPNTLIPLPGVGGVLLRGTATTDTVAAAAGLTISLSTAGFGLPAGASITVGFAYASVVPYDL